MADGGYVLTLLDVTERRQVEEALRQAQKLASMGQMTGGVAHQQTADLSRFPPCAQAG